MGRGALTARTRFGAGAALAVGGLAAGAGLVVHRPVQLPAVLLMALVGAACCVVLAWAAVRGGRWLRLGWGAVSVAAALQTAALVGALSGWSPLLVWVVLRPAALAAFAVGLIASPGVRRDLREWGLLLLDGWLIGASSFAITWWGLSATAHLGASTVPDVAPVVFVPLELVAASVCAGLALRTRAGSRVPASMLLVGSLGAVSADASWAATGWAGGAAALWLAVILLFALSTLLGRLDVFVTARPSGGARPPRVARVSQVALVPGLLACVLTRRSDLVTVGVALSLLVALAAQMQLSVRRYARLWVALQDQADRLDALVSESGDAILQVDPNGHVEFANAAAVEVFGREPHELTGRQAVDLIHPGDRGEALGELMRLERPGVDVVRIAARVRRAGGWRHVEATVSRRRSGAGYTLSTRDVSERVRLETELRRQASTDALTGLLSRTAFLAAVEARLREGPAAVLFLDLDGFKSVNDTEGHAAGDQLLVRAARAVENALRPRDLAARLGGDEFAVLSSSADLADTRSLALRLLGVLGDGPASPLGARVSASVGIAVGRQPDGGAAGLVRDADLAMYEAKKRGGRAWVMFEPWMRERVLHRTRLHAALAAAIESGSLRLEVQPIVSLPDGARVGYEALVRWDDAGRMRGAGDFVPLAEETGLVVPLGTWVLRTALQWLAGWPDESAGVAVNVASGQVADPGFGDLVRRELAASGVDPTRLTLEITERTAVDDLTRASHVLQPLRALGVHVALDDFGTGFSSLGYLDVLPVDELKIDCRFVAGLGVRQQDEALVRAVLTLAADLRLRVVAEGVETPAQARALVELGCGMAQGLLYGPAVPVERLGPMVVDLRDDREVSTITGGD